MSAYRQCKLQTISLSNVVLLLRVKDTLCCQGEECDWYRGRSWSLHPQQTGCEYISQSTS